MKALASLILAATSVAFCPFAVSQDHATSGTPSSRFSVLHAFKNPKDGLGPGSVIADSAGNLYGVSGLGGDLNCDLTGSEGCGVVFKLSSAGRELVLHRFDGSQADQGSPVGSLVRDPADNLYGTTSGNPLFCGTVFRLN